MGLKGFFKKKLCKKLLNLHPKNKKQNFSVSHKCQVE